MFRDAFYSRYTAFWFGILRKPVERGDSQHRQRRIAPQSSDVKQRRKTAQNRHQRGKTIMRGMTLSEKLLSAAAGRSVRAGEIAICEVDCAMGTDGSNPMAMDYFASMGGERVHAPHKLLFALDHYAPPASPKAAMLQAKI